MPFIYFNSKESGVNKTLTSRTFVHNQQKAIDRAGNNAYPCRVSPNNSCSFLISLSAFLMAA